METKIYNYIIKGHGKWGTGNWDMKQTTKELSTIREASNLPAFPDFVLVRYAEPGGACLSFTGIEDYCCNEENRSIDTLDPHLMKINHTDSFIRSLGLIGKIQPFSIEGVVNNTILKSLKEGRGTGMAGGVYWCIPDGEVHRKGLIDTTLTQLAHQNSPVQTTLSVMKDSIINHWERMVVDTGVKHIIKIHLVCCLAGSNAPSPAQSVAPILDPSHGLYKYGQVAMTGTVQRAMRSAFQESQKRRAADSKRSTIQKGVTLGKKKRGHGVRERSQKGMRYMGKKKKKY